MCDTSDIVQKEILGIDCTVSIKGEEVVGKEGHKQNESVSLTTLSPCTGVGNQVCKLIHDHPKIRGTYMILRVMIYNYYLVVPNILAHCLPVKEPVDTTGVTHLKLWTCFTY